MTISGNTRTVARGTSAGVATVKTECSGSAAVTIFSLDVQFATTVAHDVTRHSFSPWVTSRVCNNENYHYQ